jgi:hypothetical protein
MNAPPGKRSGPVGTGPLDEIAFARTPSLARTTDDVPWPEVQERKGDVLRLVTSRHIDARCRDCPRTFRNTGTAASHARAARHRIRVNYETQFDFVPVETVTA